MTLKILMAKKRSSTSNASSSVFTADQLPPIKIAPSVLSGDFGCLADEARRLQESGADMIHLDVMDGHFVNNLTMGPQVVAAFNRATDLFLDVHLMIYNPFDFVERFVEAGADRITFHFEATENVADTLQFIQRCNCKAGLAFCPETSETMIPNYIDLCDMILLMTVPPGHGGQAFMPEVLDKIRFAREICLKRKIALDIQVDGGINPETAKVCLQAGANIMVAGNYVFSKPDLKETIEALRLACK